jgi:ribosomal protein L44E
MDRMKKCLVGIHNWDTAKEEFVGKDVVLVVRCKDCGKAKAA